MSEVIRLHRPLDHIAARQAPSSVHGISRSEAWRQFITDSSEAEAFGIDRRRIAPGDVVPRPSTGGNRWLVLCREGEVVVVRADNSEIALVPGELSFVPAGVDFDVRNQSDARAVVELVYSRAVTPAHGH